MKSIGAASFFTTGCPSRRKPHAWDALSNRSKYCILSETHLKQLYKFVCTIPTQNSNLNLCSKPPFSRLLRHTWVKAVMLFYSYITSLLHTHTYQKVLQTNIPGKIIKSIANYIKGRKAYTTYINHTFSQRQLKPGVPQGGFLSPTLFNIYTADIPPPRAPVQVMAYVDDITITSTHTRNTYNHTYIKFLPGQNKTISH